MRTRKKKKSNKRTQSHCRNKRRMRKNKAKEGLLRWSLSLKMTSWLRSRKAGRTKKGKNK